MTHAQTINHSAATLAAVAHGNGRKLSICMLAACPFPANHGTPGSIREMAEALCELGHDVHIVTYHFGQDIAIHGPRLHRIPPWTRESTVVVGPTVRRPLYDLQMVFKTLEVIRDYRPDVLHAHGYEAALVAWLCRLASGPPVVYSGHNTMRDELASYGFIRPRWCATILAGLLDGFVPRQGDRCLPHSSNLERFFHQRGLRARTDRVVNFGIDTAWAAKGDGRRVRQRYGLEGRLVVLYTGVLDEFQRLDLLLEAIAWVKDYEPTVALLVAVTIHHPRLLDQLRRQGARLGLEKHLVLTDPQPLEGVRDCLMACDAAVVCRPRVPGFPIKLLNYMAAQKPCVVFASSASDGLVDRKNVLLAAPDTADALARAILELLRDRELAGRLAEGGGRYVREHHDRRAVAQQLCACYDRAIAARHRRSARPWPRKSSMLKRRQSAAPVDLR